MTRLSSQSIRALCSPAPQGWGGDWPEPLISPFRERTPHEISGLTGGLSMCGYDLHIAQTLVLWPGDFVLSVTIEKIHLPPDLVGILYNKSTLARQGLCMPTTVAEPGWCGYLTLELRNWGHSAIRLYAGQPIGQMMFEPLDHPTDMPYEGRYQDQGPAPQPAILLGRDA